VVPQGWGDGGGFVGSGLGNAGTWDESPGCLPAPAQVQVLFPAPGRPWRIRQVQASVVEKLRTVWVKTSTLEVLRLRAITPSVCDRSARRVAQDDGFVVSWGCKKHCLLGFLFPARQVSALGRSQAGTGCEDTGKSYSHSMVPGGLDVMS
jgi:hypothetical protein